MAAAHWLFGSLMSDQCLLADGAFFAREHVFARSPSTGTRRREEETTRFLAKQGLFCSTAGAWHRRMEYSRSQIEGNAWHMNHLASLVFVCVVNVSWSKRRDWSNMSFTHGRHLLLLLLIQMQTKLDIIVAYHQVQTIVPFLPASDKQLSEGHGHSSANAMGEVDQRLL